MLNWFKMFQKENKCDTKEATNPKRSIFKIHRKKTSIAPFFSQCRFYFAG